MVLRPFPQRTLRPQHALGPFPLEDRFLHTRLTPPGDSQTLGPGGTPGHEGEEGTLGLRQALGLPRGDVGPPSQRPHPEGLRTVLATGGVSAQALPFLPVPQLFLVLNTNS